MASLSSIDHFVLTVQDLPKTLAFYQSVLGMTAVQFSPADGSIRWALSFGNCKINLHEAGAVFMPHAQHPTAGSADVCLLTEDALEDWVYQLAMHDIAVEEGPVARSGARGPITSLYLRDPDQNLIEISTYA